MFANSHQESARCCFYRDISGFQGCSSRYGELRNFLNPEEWKSRCADRQMCWGFLVLFLIFTPCLWSETARAYTPRVEASREVYFKVPLSRCHFQDPRQQLDLLSVHAQSSSPATVKSDRNHRTARDNEREFALKTTWLTSASRHMRGRDGEGLSGLKDQLPRPGRALLRWVNFTSKENVNRAGTLYQRHSRLQNSFLQMP